MKKFLLTILVMLLILLAIFLPQILSGPNGKPFFEHALEKKFDSAISIGSVHLSWFGPQRLESIDFSNSDTTGSIESIKSNVPFWSLSQFGNSFTLKNGFFSFPKYGDLSIGEVEAKIAGHEVQATGKASQGGHFTVSGKIYSKTDFDLVTIFSGMPSAPFDPLLKANGLLIASLGPLFDLSATLVYNQGEGHLTANLSSPNAQASLQGRMVQDAFVLAEPFAATLQFTPELAQALGGRVIEAKNPLTLQIEPAGTSIPLNPLSFERLEIGHATLNLGKLVCTELHPLLSIFSLLKRGQVASSTNEIWLTPIPLSFRQGILNVGRIDALIANAIHLSAWGTIHLPSGALDMRLGIPADTLEEMLGIRGLSRNYVLQIPIRGTLQQPEFETAPATAKITALLAGNQITNKLSKKMGVFGGLVNPFNLSGKDENIPPANHPFPWE